MKYTKLSDEERRRVVNLRRGGATWVKIQRETGINRRTAKRAYDKWVRSQPLEELNAARVQVASQEFHEHLRCLVGVADALVEHLPHRMMFSDTRNADTVIDKLWMRDIGEKFESYISFHNKSELEQRRTVRQNHMLFESLRNHTCTCEEIQWSVLQEWKQAWDDCDRIRDQLQEEAKKIVGNILNDEKRQEVKNRIKKTKEGKDIIERMESGTVEAVWCGILAGKKPEEGYKSVRTKLEEGETVVLFGDPSSSVSIRLTDDNLAKEIVDVCSQATQNLGLEKLASDVKESMDTMKARASKLEGMLDPLILRPLILRSPRCNLCPA